MSGSMTITKEKYRELCDESKMLHLLAHALEAVLPVIDMFGSDELRANTHAVLDAWHLHLQMQAETGAWAEKLPLDR